MPEWVQWVSFGIAVIGAMSGLIALKLNLDRTSIVKRQEKDRLDAKKKAKFYITRGKEATSRGSQDMFYLANVGENSARNITVKFYKTKEDSSRIEISPLFTEIPKSINAGQKIKALMPLHGGMNPPFIVVLNWEDDFKNDNLIEEVLS